MEAAQALVDPEAAPNGAEAQAFLQVTAVVVEAAFLVWRLETLRRLWKKTWRKRFKARSDARKRIERLADGIDRQSTTIRLAVDDEEPADLDFIY